MSADSRRPESKGDVTTLLKQWQAGDKQALDQVIELVYDDLYAIARRHLKNESGERTLQSTALVNEAYVRLVDVDAVNWNSRAQFFAIAARIIRNILVDNARERKAAKRGGEQVKVELGDWMAAPGQSVVDVLVMDQALEALDKLDPQQAKIVELRVFGGLSVEEAADVLHISPSTVKRDWALAKGWILMQLGAARPIQ
jgi:RNA polymerase sigma factor (TIGR02999 family)